MRAAGECGDSSAGVLPRSPSSLSRASLVLLLTMLLTHFFAPHADNITDSLTRSSSSTRVIRSESVSIL